MERKPNGYWTHERCFNEALKYESKIEFKNNLMSAYVISNRNGWMPDISKHMIFKGNRYLRCVYSYEFSDNHVYVGLTYDIKEREINRKSHINDAVTKHKLATGLIPKRKILTDYIEVEKASILEGVFVEKYKNDGWVILNTKSTWY